MDSADSSPTRPPAGSPAGSSDVSAAPATPPPSGCAYEHFGRTSVVTLKPELNDVKWDAIESIGNNVESRLTDQKPDKVVFDLTPLHYIGSAMVALVARWWKRINASGGQCAVAVADDNVLEVLKLAKLDTHWDIVPSREAAYKKLGVTGRPSVGSSGLDHADSSVGGARPLWPLWVMLAGFVLFGVALVVWLMGRLPDPTLNYAMLLSGLLIAVGGLVAALKWLGSARIGGIVALVVGLILALAAAALQFLPPVEGLSDVVDDVEQSVDGAAAEAGAAGRRVLEDDDDGTVIDDGIGGRVDGRLDELDVDQNAPILPGETAAERRALQQQAAQQRAMQQSAQQRSGQPPARSPVTTPPATSPPQQRLRESPVDPSDTSDPVVDRSSGDPVIREVD